MYIKLKADTRLTPRSPQPSQNDAIDVITHWEVDEDEWEEEGIDALYCAPHCPPASILGHDMELVLGVEMDTPEAGAVLAEICGAFNEFAENQQYYNEHVVEYDGYEDALMEEMDFQYDHELPETICAVLYGCSAQELEIRQLFELGDPDNWIILDEEPVISIEEN